MAQLRNTKVNGNLEVSGTLFANGIVSMDLLWENASPTSSFGAQTISLDLQQYTHVLIIYSAKYWNGSAESLGRKSETIEVGQTGVLSYGGMGSSGAYYTHNSIRAANTTTTEVVFGKNYTSVLNGAPGSDNANVIPTAIYGIKGIQ